MNVDEIWKIIDGVLYSKKYNFTRFIKETLRFEVTDNELGKEDAISLLSILIDKLNNKEEEYSSQIQKIEALREQIENPSPIQPKESLTPITEEKTEDKEEEPERTYKKWEMYIFLMIAFVAIIMQAQHFAHLEHNGAYILPPYYTALVTAICVELTAILCGIYIKKEKNKWLGLIFFTFCGVIINLEYYQVHEIKAIADLTKSIVLPISILAYSEIFLSIRKNIKQ